jgi:N-acetylmuramoyl-L-alanine amidase
MKIVISSGHGKYIRGARGNPVPPQLDEVDEARRVVDKSAELMRASGIGVDVFHDDVSNDQSENLNRIVNFHNSKTRDLDVSVHFNAYDHSAHGTEVLYVTQSSLASKVCNAIVNAGKFTNRGAKYRSDLFFLNNTEEPAILLEVCFCDNTNDSNLYNQHFEAICEAIAESISGVQVPTEPPIEPEEPPVEPPIEPTPGEPRVEINIKATGNVTVSINGQDFHFTTEPSIPANQKNIICTVFGGEEDPNNSAYPPYEFIDDDVLGVALPFKFQGTLPKIKVKNVDTGKEVVCDIVDVGPWLTDDNYWDTDKRPLAETCYLNNDPLPRGPNEGKVPNGAGIDVTPGAAKAIGLSGKGKVNWDFVQEEFNVAEVSEESSRRRKRKT